MTISNPVEYLKFRKIDEKAIQILVTGECFYSSPFHFNDPLDCSYSLEGFPQDLMEDISRTYSGEKRQIFHDLDAMVFKKRRHINYGVVSFCGRHSDPGVVDPILGPDLWGHYADNHKGICIGFSPEKSYSTLDIKGALNPVKEGNFLRFDVPSTAGANTLLSHITSSITPFNRENLLSAKEGCVVKVGYHNNNFILQNPSWDVARKNYETLDKGKITAAKQLLNTLLENALDVRKIVANKHNNWRTENEYRLFGSANKSQAIGAAISSVTFGLETSDEAKKYLSCLISRFYGIASVGLYKMVLRNGVLTRIPFEMNDALPGAAWSRVEIT